MACDYVFAGDKVIDFDIPGTLGIVYNHQNWLHQTPRTGLPIYPS